MYTPQSVQNLSIKENIKQQFEKNWNSIFSNESKNNTKPIVKKCDGKCIECDLEIGSCLIIADR